MRRRFAAVVAAVGVGVALPAGASATALRACEGVGPVTTVVRDGQTLESSAFDGAGRLLYDDWLGGQVRALDAPTSKPRGLGTLRFPGGIARAADGRIAIAEGNGFASLIGGSSVHLLDPATGVRTRVAAKMVGANGLARAADGTTYASDTPAGVIDRVAPDGQVTKAWWRGSGGPNGLALSADGRTLFASLSLSSRVVAIDTTTKAMRTILRVAGLAPVPDGLAIDAAGQLYVALYLAGEVLRIDPATGVGCRLARGLQLPTSIALAPPAGDFDQTSAYVTSFGAVKRIAGAVAVDAAAH